MEISPCCNSTACHQIATNFCTCHDSTAVVPRTKFCCDHWVRIDVSVKRNFDRIWIAAENPLVKCAQLYSETSGRTQPLVSHPEGIADISHFHNSQWPFRASVLKVLGSGNLKSITTWIRPTYNTNTSYLLNDTSIADVGFTEALLERRGASVNFVVSYHHQIDWWFNNLYKASNRKHQSSVFLAICEGNPPVALNNAESISVPWCPLADHGYIYSLATSEYNMIYFTRNDS